MSPSYKKRKKARRDDILKLISNKPVDAIVGMTANQLTRLIQFGTPPKPVGVTKVYRKRISQQWVRCLTFENGSQIFLSAEPLDK